MARYLVDETFSCCLDENNASLRTVQTLEKYYSETTVASNDSVADCHNNNNSNSSNMVDIIKLPPSATPITLSSP
jgi:hypothetical protein